MGNIPRDNYTFETVKIIWFNNPPQQTRIQFRDYTFGTWVTASTTDDSANGNTVKTYIFNATGEFDGFRIYGAVRGNTDLMEVYDIYITAVRNFHPQPPAPISSISLLILLLLGMLWLGFFVAGTGLKTGFFVILSGVSALLFAITAWTTTNDIPSSILLFAAATFTLIWSLRVIMEERSAAG